MTRHIFLFFTIVSAGAAFAASVDVKDLDTSDDTTIEIHKGKKKAEDKPDSPPELRVEDHNVIHKHLETDTVDITGASAAITSEARKTWRTACDNWIKDFKEKNKEVINITCGQPTCGGEVGNKTCVSKATYRIKTSDD